MFESDHGSDADVLNGTSKFGVSDKTDKTFDPLIEFNA